MTSAFARNVAANLVGALVPVAVTLITVPFYIHEVGTARYGVLLLAGALLGYFGLFDFGLGRATTNVMSRLAQAGDRDGVVETFWTTLCVNAGLAALAALVLYLVAGYAFIHFIKIPPEVRGEVMASIGYLAAMLSVTIVMGVAIGAVEAHERFVLLNGVQAAGTVIGQMLPLLIVMTLGSDLRPILLAMLVARVLTAAALFWLAVRVMGGLHGRPRIVVARLRSLGWFGGWVTLTNVVSPILTTFDQFVIGNISGAQAIPTYAVPMNVIQRALILPGILERALFPRLSRESEDDRQVTTLRSVRVLCSTMTPVIVAAILLGPPFLHWWIGAGFGESASPILRILAAGAWLNAFGYVMFTTLQAQGRPDRVAKTHAAELLPYLLLLWVSVREFGVLGAAVAWAVRVAVDWAVLAWAAGYRLRDLRAIAHGAVAVLAAFLIGQFMEPRPLAALLATAGLIGSFALVDFRANADVARLVRLGLAWTRRFAANGAS